MKPFYALEHSSSFSDWTTPAGDMLRMVAMGSGAMANNVTRFQLVACLAHSETFDIEAGCGLSVLLTLRADRSCASSGVHLSSFVYAQTAATTHPTKVQPKNKFRMNIASLFFLPCLRAK